jgi:hypothetical protein
LTVTLTRILHLPGVSRSQTPPLQISDTLTTVAFRGPEYIIPPGVEGVARLVFDVPNYARGVKGGTRDGDEEEARTTEALFEVRCIVGLKMLMGIGRCETPKYMGPSLTSNPEYNLARIYVLISLLRLFTHLPCQSYLPRTPRLTHHIPISIHRQSWTPSFPFLQSVLSYPSLMERRAHTCSQHPHPYSLSSVRDMSGCHPLLISLFLFTVYLLRFLVKIIISTRRLHIITRHVHQVPLLQASSTSPANNSFPLT